MERAAPAADYRFLKVFSGQLGQGGEGKERRRKIIGDKKGGVGVVGRGAGPRG